MASICYFMHKIITQIHSGHKSAVTSLKFDGSGTRLVSGSKDTHLILWDVVSQTGLFR